MIRLKGLSHLIYRGMEIRMTKRQFRKREANRKAVNERIMEQLVAFQSQDNECLALKHFFERNSIESFAIYGGGLVGKEFNRVCQKCHIRPEYFIDKFISGKIEGIPIYQYRVDFLPEVDAVIIVPCHEKEFIKFEISNYFTDTCRLIGIDDCIKELEEM